jgi:hypothetical protein
VAWVSGEPLGDSEFLDALRRSGALVSSHDGVESIELSHLECTPLLIILPFPEDARALRGEVAKILMKNARAHFAVRSDLGEKVVHDACEGLGILGRIPLRPKAADAAPLIERLRRVLAY